MASTSAPWVSSRAVRDEVRRLERDTEWCASKGDTSLDVDDASSSATRTTAREPRVMTAPSQPDTPPRPLERSMDRDRPPALPSTSRAAKPATAPSADALSIPSDDSTLEELRFANHDAPRAAAPPPDAAPPNAAARCCARASCARGTGLDSFLVPQRERRALLLHPVPVETFRPVDSRVSSRVPGGVHARRLRRRRVHEQTRHALLADDSTSGRRSTRTTRRRRAVHARQKLQSARAAKRPSRRVPRR